MRKVMALPFLPADHIEEAFDNLMEQAEQLGNDQLLSFMVYVKRTWIDSQVWPPLNWSVFDETTRTNNDVEGWHHRMNLKINGIDDRQEEQVQENTRQAVQAVGGLRGRHHRHRPPTQARGPPGRVWPHRACCRGVRRNENTVHIVYMFFIILTNIHCKKNSSWLSWI